jgi:hypothetical protein
MLPSSINSVGHVQPQFGMLMKIHSQAPTRAFAYGQEVLENLNGKQEAPEKRIKTFQSSSLIVDPQEMASAAYSLGLLETLGIKGVQTEEELDPKKAHGFKDPQDEKSFWIVADAPETLPHGSTYVTLKNALQNLIAKSGLSLDDKKKAEISIQHSFTQQKPNFSIEV